MPRVDLTGKKFDRLTVLGPSIRSGNKNGAYWMCECVCGTKKSIYGLSLRRGLSRSCGCRRSEVSAAMMTTHGMNGTLTHVVWTGMTERCRNKNNKLWKYYGGRGILVCDRWMRFENFLADMGERPVGMSLDRIDCDAGYSPENCRWADRITQANNRRDNFIIKYAGESLTITQAAEKYNVPRATLKCRLHRGWTADRAITQPVNQTKRLASIKAAL